MGRRVGVHDADGRHPPLPGVADQHRGPRRRAHRTGLEPDDATTDDILRRCRELVLALATAEVLGVRVGLRPARPEVRLELVESGETSPVPVIHCYGHGGVGVTVSWGCADEVAALAD